MAEYRFREPKTFVDEEEFVVNVVPEPTRYKNKWAARIFEEWAKARFSKAATLEPVGVFSGAPRAPKARARGAPYLRKYGNPSM